MAFQHGYETVVTLAGNDLSEFSNQTTFEDSTEAKKVTTYGKVRQVYGAGLGDGKVTLTGYYETSAIGPRAIIKPLKVARLPVEFIFRPEGTGSGKAQSRVDVIITSYNESDPVEEFITWTCEMQMTDDLDETDQA